LKEEKEKKNEEYLLCHKSQMSRETYPTAREKSAPVPRSREGEDLKKEGEASRHELKQCPVALINDTYCARLKCRDQLKSDLMGDGAAKKKGRQG